MFSKVNLVLVLFSILLFAACESSVENIGRDYGTTDVMLNDEGFGDMVHDGSADVEEDVSNDISNEETGFGDTSGGDYSFSKDSEIDDAGFSDYDGPIDIVNIQDGNIHDISTDGDSQDTFINDTFSDTGCIGNCAIVDLLFTSVVAPKSADNNIPFSITITIKNAGSDPSGRFKVKGYFSVDEIPNNGGSPADQLLFTWDVNNLGAGASETKTFSDVRFKYFPIHSTYYIVVKVDADDEVTETDESNNIVTRSVFVSR